MLRYSAETAITRERLLKITKEYQPYPLRLTFTLEQNILCYASKHFASRKVFSAEVVYLKVSVD